MTGKPEVMDYFKFKQAAYFCIFYLLSTKTLKTKTSNELLSIINTIYVAKA